MAPPVEERRSFLVWVISGLGALFAVIFGAPVVAYVIDPRNRKGSAGAFKLADGVRLDALSPQTPVVQGVIRDVRRDAWSIHPNDVLGRVWVVLQPGKTIPADPTARAALMGYRVADGVNLPLADAPLRVFTTICPHLGCSVNLAAEGSSFICPCHGATFALDGDRINPAHSVANRGMDELAWQADPGDPEGRRLLVEYRNFKSSCVEKIVL